MRQLPAHVIALDTLGASIARLDDLTRRPEAEVATLREQGVLDQTRADILMQLPSAVEVLAKAEVPKAVPNADDLTKNKGNVSQPLDHTADLFAEAGYAGLPTRVGTTTWDG